MGKKDQHLNSILYPEYLTSLTDDNYINVPGDNEHHGHSAHWFAHYFKGQEEEAKQALK